MPNKLSIIQNLLEIAHKSYQFFLIYLGMNE